MEDPIKEIKENIDSLAKSVILKDPRNSALIENIDSVQEHAPKWHEFGIKTHTLKVLDNYDSLLPEFLSEWDLTEKYNQQINNPIDGIKKDTLFRASILLHDIGKWARTFEAIENGRWKPSYKDHEKLSKEIILGNQVTKDVYNFLKDSCNFTNNQIEYIAESAGLHYELGHFRTLIKKSSDLQYNVEVINTETFYSCCEELYKSNERYIWEIGIFYLIDNLGKTTLWFEEKSHKKVEERIPTILKDLSSQSKEHLLDAVLDTPVVISITKGYFNHAQKKDVI